MSTDLVVKTTYERNFPTRRLHRAECWHARTAEGRMDYNPDRPDHRRAKPCKACKPEVPSYG